MTRLLRLSDAAWPRSRADLQTAYPLTGFPVDLASMSPADLAEFDHCIPTPTPAPSPGPLEQVDEVHPVLVDGEWRQAWQLVPLAPAPPAPDWDQFRQALQTENGFPSAWLTAFQANPQVAGLVASRLDLYEVNGNYHLFIHALLAALATLNNQAQAAEVAVEFAALAERCNMPAEFLEELDRRLLGSPG